jgi:STE24 endopeptidase
MRILVIAIFLATTAFGFFLKYLTYSKRNAELPENVRDVYDEEAYKKNRAYLMEKIKFSLISGAVGMVVTLAFLLLNYHHSLFAFITQHTTNAYLTSMFILAVPILIGTAVDAVVGIGNTFGIEARYGFNKTTPATYIIDILKNILLIGIIGGGLLSLFILLNDAMGDWVYLTFFFVLVGFIFFVSFISPLLIRIFYKLTPLEDGSLKDKIEAFADKTGYKLKGIYMVNASKRSTKMNAFASGFGKTKTIGLFDTLAEKMTEEEIVSILAHEIGHAKFKHIVKSAPFRFVTLGIMVAAAYFIISMPAVSQAFGFADANMAFGIFVLSIMLSPILLILDIPANALSRKYEYEADAYEVEQCGAETAVSAIKKLYREDLGNLTPHPFVVMMEASHPTLTQRVAAMEKQGNE